MTFTLPSSVVGAALGAARVVASADGRFDQHERRLLEAAGRALGWERDAASVDLVSPAELASAVKDDTTRLRVVQALILVALMDGEVKDAELQAIRTYAAALSVDEPRLRNLEQLAHGHTKLVAWDLLRRSAYLRDAARKAWEDKGLGGLLAYYGSVVGLHHDPELATRYEALGNLPEGTLGREYFEHMKVRGFSLPGAHKGFPEELVKHDLAHVLGGYDTDGPGECEVIAFISGFNRSDPFGYLFMIVLHMQLGVNVFDGSPVERLIMPTERVVAALARGSKVTRDLYDPSWRFWDDFPKPIDEVRRGYGIEPA